MITMVDLYCFWSKSQVLGEVSLREGATVSDLRLAIQQDLCQVRLVHDSQTQLHNMIESWILCTCCAGGRVWFEP
jgi:hypothetical protein